MWIKIEERDLGRLREIVVVEANKVQAIVRECQQKLGVNPVKNGETERRLLAAIENPRDLEKEVRDKLDEAALGLDYAGVTGAPEEKKEGLAMSLESYQGVLAMLEILK